PCRHLPHHPCRENHLNESRGYVVSCLLPSFSPSCLSCRVSVTLPEASKLPGGWVSIHSFLIIFNDPRAEIVHGVFDQWVGCIVVVADIGRNGARQLGLVAQLAF